MPRPKRANKSAIIKLLFKMPDLLVHKKLWIIDCK